MFAPSFYNPIEFAHIAGWDPKPRVIALLQTPAHREVALRLTLVREPTPDDVHPAAVNAFLLYMNAFKSVMRHEYPQAHRLQQLCSNECGRRWRLMSNTDKTWWVEESARHRRTVAPNPNSRARRRRRAQGDFLMDSVSTSVALSARRGRVADAVIVETSASDARHSTSSPTALELSPCSPSSEESSFSSPTMSTMSAAASSDEDDRHASTVAPSVRTHSAPTLQSAASMNSPATTTVVHNSGTVWCQHVTSYYLGASQFRFHSGADDELADDLPPILYSEVEFQHTNQHSVFLQQSPAYQHVVPNNDESCYYAAPTLPFPLGTAITIPAYTTPVIAPQPHYAARTASFLDLPSTHHVPEVHSSNMYQYPNNSHA